MEKLHLQDKEGGDVLLRRSHFGNVGRGGRGRQKEIPAWSCLNSNK